LLAEAYKKDEFLAKPYNEGYEVFKEIRGTDKNGRKAGFFVNDAGPMWYVQYIVSLVCLHSF